jgi:hypothetical protein
MTPGDRTSCLGAPSPHALSQRLLEYSRSRGFPQDGTGTIQLVLGLSESDLRDSAGGWRYCLKNNGRIVRTKSARQRGLD